MVGNLFNIQPYFSLEDAKISLYEMINLEIKRNRTYYVDNDFFENVFPPNLQNSKYFCVKERNCTEWSKVSNERKNNIIYFNKVC